jgi:signal transduction histidine kinase
LYLYGIKQLGSGRELLSGSFRMRRRDGRFVWVETISRSLKDAVTGEIVGWVSNTRDISARKRVEQIKDEFISTVSHELRTPLTAMLGSIGLAASGRFGAPDGQLKRLLDIADTNGQRLAQLVNDILDWEKVSSGKMRFECQPAAVDELVDQAIAATRPYAEKFDIALQARQRAPDVTISVDGNRFQQIMANLLSNAAKFSPSGSTVEIDASVAEGRCRISIIDHGYGIPADFRSNLFERFSRADSSDGSQRGGTGLGMAIARQMTEGMSGTITFESQENVGTTFHLYFPLSSSKANAA